MLEEGHPAPEFTLPSVDGGEISLADFRGRPLVLYFYPKDDTPGCTAQACELRDDMARLEELGASVVGVSPDPVKSHRKFRDKYNLNFPLLADTDHEVAETYGVWKEKSMYGRTYWGVERSTFILDEEGRIEAAWRRVKPKGHAERVVEHLAGR